MKEETGQRQREDTLPMVIFDPSKSSGLSADITCRSFYNTNDNFHKDGITDDKKCAKACSLHKKVSFQTFCL